jgi:hypothetical protein
MFFSHHDPAEVERGCPTCEVLKQQLAVANLEKRTLLNMLQPMQARVQPLDPPEFESVPSNQSWEQEKARLEREDAELHQRQMDALRQEIDTLEKEVLK